MQELETEEFLGSLLYFMGGEVSLNVIKKCRDCLGEKLSTYVELSDVDIQLAARTLEDYFIIRKNRLELTDYYKEYRDKIKNKFFDRMGDEKQKNFWEILNEIE